MTDTPKAYVHIENLFVEDLGDYVTFDAVGYAWVIDGSDWAIIPWGFGNGDERVESLAGDPDDNFQMNFAPDTGFQNETALAIDSFCDRSDWRAQARDLVNAAVKAALDKEGGSVSTVA